MFKSPASPKSAQYYTLNGGASHEIRKLGWAVTTSALAGPITTTVDFTGTPCGTVSGMFATGFVGGDGSTSAVATAITNFGLVIGSATCTVTVTAELQTLGPVRPGFLEFSLSGGADGSSGASYGDAFLVGSGYGVCGDQCLAFGEHGFAIDSNVIPFTLGVPFEMQAKAWASDGPTFFGGGAIQATFHIYDSSGDAAIFVFVPEPGTLPLSLLGFASSVILLCAKGRL